jgi:type VI protein secretion system component Hcp
MIKLYLLIASIGWIFTLQAQSSTDRITYTVTGTGFSTTELEVLSLTQEETRPISSTNGYGKPTLNNFNFTKPADINSKTFNQTIATGPSPRIASIEFKIYAAGAATPYISFQVKNVVVSKFKPSAASGSGGYLEDISLSFENWGFKDWVNNLSYGFSFLSQTASAY